METAIMDWVLAGAGVVAFILLGKMLFVGLNVPVLGPMFAAV